MPHPTVRLFERLLTDEVVPASQVPAASKNGLDALLASGAVENLSSGRGRSIKIAKKPIVEAYLDHNFPDWRAPADRDEIGTRVAGLQASRDTKRIAGLEFELVHIRIYSTVAIAAIDGNVDLSEVTRRVGCASLVLSGQNDPVMSGRIALVEGPTLFMRMNWEEMGFDCVVYYAGRMSDRMLSWLCDCSPGFLAVTHFPDYDPVGLNEWIRLKARIRSGLANLYVPVNIEELFRNWSKPELLSKSKSLIPKLLTSGDPNVDRLVQLMHLYNAGLEHEALLI